MNILYLVIEKSKDDREISNIVAVCSEYKIARGHLNVYRKGSVKSGNDFEYEIIGLSFDDVDKLTGAVKYLKNKIKEKLEKCVMKKLATKINKI